MKIDGVNYSVTVAAVDTLVRIAVICGVIYGVFVLHDIEKNRKIAAAERESQKLSSMLRIKEQQTRSKDQLMGHITRTKIDNASKELSKTRDSITSATLELQKLTSKLSDMEATWKRTNEALTNRYNTLVSEIKACHATMARNRVNNVSNADYTARLESLKSELQTVISSQQAQGTFDRCQKVIELRTKCEQLQAELTDLRRTEYIRKLVLDKLVN